MGCVCDRTFYVITKESYIPANVVLVPFSIGASTLGLLDANIPFFLLQLHHANVCVATDQERWLPRFTTGATDRCSAWRFSAASKHLERYMSAFMYTTYFSDFDITGGGETPATHFWYSMPKPGWSWMSLCVWVEHNILVRNEFLLKL